MPHLTAGTNRALLPRASFPLKDSHWSSVHSLLIYWRGTLTSVHIYLLNDERINGIW